MSRLQQEVIITLTPPEDYVEPGLFDTAEDGSDDDDDSERAGQILKAMRDA